ASTSTRTHDELARLAKEHQRVRAIDYFGAPGGAEVRRLEEAIAMRTRRPEAARPAPAPTLDLTKLRGRRWVTRPRPHVDRIASAWLIKRFIDPEAVFVFAPPAEFPKDAIAFDAPGVELSHHGEDCTFETLVKRGRLRDRRLARLAEIVHEADLRDGKYPHEEARGIDVAIRALLAASPDDHQVLAHGTTLFEGLYATTSRKCWRGRQRWSCSSTSSIWGASGSAGRWRRSATCIAASSSAANGAPGRRTCSRWRSG